MKIVKIDKDQVFQAIDFNNNNLSLVKFNKGTAFLEVNQATFAGEFPMLMVKKEHNNGYFVKGCYGAKLCGVENFSGYVSTQQLLKGLNKLGFCMDAKQLRKWICA